jgi:hypothetical protein
MCITQFKESHRAFARFDVRRNDWTLGEFLISRGLSSPLDRNDADGSRPDLLDVGNAGYSRLHP